MDEHALYAVVAVIAGVALGTLGGGLTRRFLQRDQRAPRLRLVAAPAAAIVFWVALAAGIAIGVGLLAPDAVRPLPEHVLSYLPRVLVAGLMLITGYAAATATAIILSGGLARATGRTRREAALSLRIAIMTMVTLLALGQLDVDTTILTIAVAALLFGTATALALLIGLGGRDLAREVAAGRYLQRIIRPGDHIETTRVTGRVTTLHPATIEVETEPAGTLHVPHTHLLSDSIHVRRQSPRHHSEQPSPEHPAAG
jgi:small-conductance mechanosensitive channel